MTRRVVFEEGEAEARYEWFWATTNFHYISNCSAMQGDHVRAHGQKPERGKKVSQQVKAEMMDDDE